MSWFPFCPGPPDWWVDWSAIERAFDWVGELAACPQDPLHHAEGDVATHTRLACEALAALPAYRSRAPEERILLFAAALLHDVAKPACTRREPDGRITARGHARRGAIGARAILWRLGAPLVAREQIAAILRHHQLPFYLIERPDSRHQAIWASQTAPCDLLALVAEADARGRICDDQTRLLDNVALFAAYNARVRIAYLEVPEARLLRQNRARPTPVLEAVIDRLLARWELPDRTEAHRVDWIAE